jgi:hypothetical protein
MNHATSPFILGTLGQKKKKTTLKSGGIEKVCAGIEFA